jgi:hypothetical protein
MTRPGLRTGLLAALAVSLAGSGGLVAIGLGASGGGLPDLVPYLPDNAPGTERGTPHPRFMDTLQEKGHTLLRFDTALLNTGSGPLDIFTTGNGDLRAYQYVWPAGTTPAIDESAPAPDPASWHPLAGHDMFYYPAPGHEHFHFPHAASYELVNRDGTVVGDSPKNDVGFCLFDSYGTGPFTPAACRPGQPGWTGVVRMGISAGSGDLYGAPLTDQWVDVTRVMPGPYLVRATANPDGVIEESDSSDNVKVFPITVAGARPTSPTAATDPGRPVSVRLGARIYGASMQSRTRLCEDMYDDDSCFTVNRRPDRAYLAVTGATGGTARIVSRAGLAATARFTPAPGFTGTARFTYTATDARGLHSPPATVRISVGGSRLSRAGRRRVVLAPAMTVTRHRGRWAIHVRGHVTRALAGRRLTVQRRSGARVMPIARIAVRRDGRYDAYVRMPSRRAVVRLRAAATPATRAAVSRFRALHR